MAKSDFRFHYPIRVRWSDCDVQGVVYAGRYQDYLAIAEVEYYRNLGFDMYALGRRNYYDTAAVKSTLEYRAPARLDQLIEVHHKVSNIGETSITMESEIYRTGSEELLTRAMVIYVSFNAEKQAKQPMPEDIRTLVTHFEDTGEILPIERFPNLVTPG